MLFTPAPFSLHHTWLYHFESSKKQKARQIRANDRFVMHTFAKDGGGVGGEGRSRQRERATRSIKGRKKQTVMEFWESDSG